MLNLDTHILVFALAGALEEKEQMQEQALLQSELMQTFFYKT